LELANADKQQTNLPERDEVFQKALFDYNTANPSRQIAIDYQQESPTFSVIGSILLGLLPVLLIGGFFYDAAGAKALRRDAFGGEAGAEFVFAQQVLARVAAAARRQDVLDPVRAPTSEWNAMVLFE
jgi:hypothetical protein